MVLLGSFAVVGLVSLVVGVITAVDAGSLPEWAFERAGTSKTLWIVLPLVGAFACGVLSLVAAVMWFGSYKPRVVAARGSAG